MAAGELVIEHLATHVMPLEDGARGYQMFKDKTHGCVTRHGVPEPADRLAEVAAPAAGPSSAGGPAFLLGLTTPHAVVDPGLQGPAQAGGLDGAAPAHRLGLGDLEDRRADTTGEEQLRVLTAAGRLLPPAHVDPAPAAADLAASTDASRVCWSTLVMGRDLTSEEVARPLPPTRPRNRVPASGVGSPRVRERSAVHFWSCPELDTDPATAPLGALYSGAVSGAMNPRAWSPTPRTGVRDHLNPRAGGHGLLTSWPQSVTSSRPAIRGVSRSRGSGAPARRPARRW